MYCQIYMPIRSKRDTYIWETMHSKDLSHVKSSDYYDARQSNSKGHAALLPILYTNFCPSPLLLSNNTFNICIETSIVLVMTYSQVITLYLQMRCVSYRDARFDDGHEGAQQVLLM